MQEMWETRVQWSLGQEDPLDEGMAVHSSILAWRIPWTEVPGRVQSIGLQRVKNYWSDLACTHASLNEVIRVDSKQYDWCLMKKRRNWSTQRGICRGKILRNRRENATYKAKIAWMIPESRKVQKDPSLTLVSDFSPPDCGTLLQQPQGTDTLS